MDSLKRNRQFHKLGEGNKIFIVEQTSLYKYLVQLNWQKPIFLLLVSIISLNICGIDKRPEYDDVDVRFCDLGLLLFVLHYLSLVISC